MGVGPERARLRRYLQGARHDATGGAGLSWTASSELLDSVSTAMVRGAQQVREGGSTGDGLTGVTAEAVLEAFAASATSMREKAVRIRAAGEALQETAEVMRRAEQAEAGMAVLDQPPAYSPPTYSPGYQPTPAEIQAEGAQRSAARSRMAAYTTARADQESAASAWAQRMDAAFLAAIPPMQAIHGEPDPTAPPPGGPSAPSGPSLPATPSTGGGSTGGGSTGSPAPGSGHPTAQVLVQAPPVDPPGPEPTQAQPQPQTQGPAPTQTQTPDPSPGSTPTTHPTSAPTSTIGGESQSGVTYQAGAGATPGAPATPVTSASATAGAAGIGAAGMAGGAGGMAAANGVRSSAPAPGPAGTRGAAPVRTIGATSRSGSPGSLSRGASAPGSAPAQGAGASSGRGSGSPTSRGGSAGGRGTAGGRGAGSSGSPGSAGSRSGGRGGAAGANGRGGRRATDERTSQRDSLVYDQDWLGDDDVAPGLLD